MLKLSMKSTISRKAKSRVAFLYSSENVLNFEAMYIENDVTKSIISGTLDIESTLELLGDLSAILNGQQKSSVIKVDSDSGDDIILSIMMNDKESTLDRNIYLIRFENVQEASFIQFQEEAGKFYSLLYLLENVFRRMS